MARFFKHTAILAFVMMAAFAGGRGALADDGFKPGECYDYERETVFNGNPKTSYGEICLGKDKKWTMSNERFSNPPIDKSNTVIVVVGDQGVLHVTRSVPQSRHYRRYDRRYHYDDDRRPPRPRPRPPSRDNSDEDEVKDEGGMPKGLDFSK